MKKKLFSRSGETLVETLMAIMILAISVTVLATAVVTASHINSRILDQDLDFSYDQMPAIVGDIQIGEGTIPNVTIYENNGYYYYEP